MSTAHANKQSPLSTTDGLIAAEDIPVNDQDEIDSIFSEESVQSATTSIASSILEYRKIHGRTYHSDKFTTNYFIPNDDQQLESEQLWSHHFLTILLDDQLFLAPLEKDKTHRVLDVGTGSGIWAVEFADQFPNASVIGTDLSPCQPQWVPPNVCFEIDDAMLEWTYDDNHFDFIHMRYIVGGIQDWTAFFKEAYRCCAPGGWVESLEYEAEICSDDGSTNLEPVLASYGELFRQAGEVMKRPLFVHEILPQALEEAGFIDKRVVRYKIPIGPWAKDPKSAEVGRFTREALENDLQGYTQMLWQSVQKPEDEYHVWLASMRKAIRNPKVHSYGMIQVVYGRKPFAAESAITELTLINCDQDLMPLQAQKTTMNGTAIGIDSRAIGGS
ncbi:uncharacterized protein CPUR_02532 [Claviceps purpurea 20.1]|uniref:Methyltransferase n=1 Tax=Claviceps purpurea (strain 20.1) TaxID=1111077 RepID=M1W7Z5_CLAP2|nr:uncharacterized protein CPUR_02532 [Claviceps purpurea 20.1]